MNTEQASKRAMWTPSLLKQDEGRCLDLKRATPARSGAAGALVRGCEQRIDAVKESDILQKGDLLFNWRNGSQNHLGKTAYFSGDERFTHVGFLLKIRTFNGKCDSRFLLSLINDLKSKGYFLTAKIQVNNTFNSSELRAVRLPMPTFDEQITIRKR
jgi:restriction endonuclease S subunit